MQKSLTQIQSKIHRLAGTDSNSYTSVEMNEDINSAIAELEIEANFSDSDSEHDDPRFDNTNGGRPTGTIDLELNQDVYSFYEDADGNRILTVYKVVRFGNDGEKSVLVQGVDYDVEGSSIILAKTDEKARIPGEEKNLLEIHFTRQGLGFNDADDADTQYSPFPADFDSFYIYKCVAEWCLSEAEDPAMRAKGDRYEAKANAIKPRFRKWLQRRYGRGMARLTGRRTNLR